MTDKMSPAAVSSNLADLYQVLGANMDRWEKFGIYPPHLDALLEAQRMWDGPTRGPILPEEPTAEIIGAMLRAYRLGEGAGLFSQVYAALREELLRPRTRKAWRVTAVSPGGMPYEIVTDPTDRFIGNPKTHAKNLAYAKLADDYTNVSVTEIEVPA